MWVKICGIKDLESARLIAGLKPDAVGLNFFAKSSRCVGLETAEKIAAELSENVDCVGLFVNHELSEVQEISQRCQLEFIQLHGDERPEFLAELLEFNPKINIIKAFRIGEAGFDSVAGYLEECTRLSIRPFACLIDADVPGEYGGTGECVSWDGLRAAYRPEWPPLILAGGLKPANVGTAIQAVGPWGVDVASGVESSPGVKELSLVKSFIENAREAD